MKDMYLINKNIDKLYSDGYTYFLDLKNQNSLNKKIKQNYKKFIPFNESERIIYYIDKLPEIVLYEIISYERLRHQDIMGTIYSLGVDEMLFGDIVVDENRYFVYLFKSIENYFVNNFNKVKNVNISLIKRDIDYLSNYTRKYEDITIISSSERIDTIVSKITNINRKEITDKLKNDEILVNYVPIKNNSYIMKNNDIFSIRKFGKFKYIGIINYTKKNNLVIKIQKYI